MAATDNLIADAAARLFATAMAADEPFDAALWTEFRASGLAGILAEGSVADAVSVPVRGSRDAMSSQASRSPAAP